MTPTDDGPEADATVRDVPPFETITVRRVGPVGLVTLNRPEQGNALGPLMWVDLGLAFTRFDADDAVRAIVVVGAGDHFCVGTDTGAARDTFRDRLRQRTRLAEKLGAPRRNPWEMSTPVIGALNGSAIGVGATLPLPWDIRIAADDAPISFAFVRHGSLPEGNSHWLLPRLIGTSRATDLLLTGRVISGREAVEMGLVSQAVPREEVLDRALELGRDVARNTAPLSAGLTKRLLASALETGDRAASQRRENALFRWVAGQVDAGEGVAAAAERRPPRWTVSKNLRAPAGLDPQM